MRQTYRRISFCAFHVMRTILRPNADIDYWMLHAAQYAALLTPYHGRLRPYRVRLTVLEVNEAKSGAGPSGGSQLLGFRIHETGNVGIAPKALQRLKERVRQLWDARQSLKSEELRAQWQRYMTGWWNYFGYANWRKEVTRLSGWIRRHMRKCFWLRWHNRAGRYNALRRLGVRGRGLNVAGCRRGAWPMATHVVVNQALKTATLNRFGFTLPWELAGA